MSKLNISRAKSSPNFGERRLAVNPSIIVIHYTGMNTAKEALDRLCDHESGVSAHYFIEEDGNVLQLVEDDKRAWHAGDSYWNGENDINSHSIGIELVNPGHEFGYSEFKEPQVASLIELCNSQIKKWGISNKNIIGHSDIAPSRKQDPGELFPWKQLAENGVGIWPEPNASSHKQAANIIGNIHSQQELLVRYGYNPDEKFTDILRAYHMHFCPENLTAKSMDTESASRLLAIL